MRMNDLAMQSHYNYSLYTLMMFRLIDFRCEKLAHIVCVCVCGSVFICSCVFNQTWPHYIFWKKKYISVCFYSLRWVLCSSHTISHSAVAFFPPRSSQQQKNNHLTPICNDSFHKQFNLVLKRKAIIYWYDTLCMLMCMLVWMVHLKKVQEDDDDDDVDNLISIVETNPFQICKFANVHPRLIVTNCFSMKSGC